MQLSMSLLCSLFILSPIVPSFCVTIHHATSPSTTSEATSNQFHHFHHSPYSPSGHSLTRRMAYGLLVANPAPAPMQIAAMPAGFQLPQNYFATPDQGAIGGPFGFTAATGYGASLPGYGSPGASAASPGAPGNTYTQSLSSLISPLFGTSSYTPFISSIFGRR